MHIAIDRLITDFGVYFWVFLRVSGFLLAAPVFGDPLLPRRVKIVLGLGLTVLLAPLLPAASVPAHFGPEAALRVADELLAGLAIGFATQVAFQALVVAGEAIGLTMGIGFASLIDPVHNSSMPLVAQLYQIVGLLLFLSLGGHLALVGTLADSFRWTRPDGAAVVGQAQLYALALLGGRIFAAGVVIALPAVVALLIVNLALGVVSRASPQLNLFAVGFPASMMFGFLVLIESLPAVRGAFERLMSSSLETAAFLVGS
jgi:flagellar biosynthesis protein FliR